MLSSTRGVDHLSSTEPKPLRSVPGDVRNVLPGMLPVPDRTRTNVSSPGHPGEDHEKVEFKSLVLDERSGRVHDCTVEEYLREIDNWRVQLPLSGRENRIHLDGVISVLPRGHGELQVQLGQLTLRIALEGGELHHL